MRKTERKMRWTLAALFLGGMALLYPAVRAEAASLPGTQITVSMLSETMIQITASEVSGANMYQYQVAKDSTFSIGLRSKKSRSLVKSFGSLTAGDTYYVRVRGYRKPVNGKRRFGTWSETVTISLRSAEDAFYSDVLKKYKQAYTEGWGAEKLRQEELNSDADTATLGYCYLDLNQDGEKELLIGQAKGAYGVKGEFLALYAIVDEKPLLLEWSEYRHQASLCQKSGARYVNVYGSNGATNGVDASYYSFDGSKMKLEEEIIYDYTLNRSNPYFYSTSDSYLKSDLLPITEAQRNAITGKYTVLPVAYRSIAYCHP